MIRRTVVGVGMSSRSSEGEEARAGQGQHPTIRDPGTSAGIRSWRCRADRLAHVRSVQLDQQCSRSIRLAPLGAARYPRTAMLGQSPASGVTASGIEGLLAGVDTCQADVLGRTTASGKMVEHGVREQSGQSRSQRLAGDPEDAGLAPRIT